MGVVGITNRKEKLDAALLRPGRLGVHIEVGMLDQKGREQVLAIHTQALVANGMLAPDVSLRDLARASEGLCGAELRYVVSSAVAVAFLRAGRVAPGFVDAAAFASAFGE